MARMEATKRTVIEHLPWLDAFTEWYTVPPPDPRLSGLRLRLGRATRVGSGHLFDQTLAHRSPWRGVLPSGTTLRFAEISSGCEDPCSWFGPPAPVFVIENGPLEGMEIGLYTDWLDDLGVEEALAIEEIGPGPDAALAGQA